MRENDCNTYYALVWSTILSSKKKETIKGEKITKSTVLPNDPRILYGTSNNDVIKIRNVEMWKEIEYDIATTKQTVRFHKEIKEYILCRDVRIIIWQGSEELNLPSDEYRIVTPELFEIITQLTNNYGSEEVNNYVGEEEEIGRWKPYKDPKQEIKSNINQNLINKVKEEMVKVNEVVKGKYIKLMMIEA